MESSSEWGSNFKINLVLLSFALGMGIPKSLSVWLFETNVGIIFLIPVQLLVIIIVIIPCIFLELGLGQYSTRTTIKIWDLCPMFRGIGICSVVNFIILQMCYVQICAYTLWFSLISIVNKPEWQHCNTTWATNNCVILNEERPPFPKWETSSEQFIKYHLYNTNENLGAPQIKPLIFSLVTTVIIFMGNTGPKSMRKFLILLAVVPTFFSLILLIMPLASRFGFQALYVALTKGSLKQLKEPGKWVRFIQTNLATCGLCCGYITIGARCPFRNPLHLKAITIGGLIVVFGIFYALTIGIFLQVTMIDNKIPFELISHLHIIPEGAFFAPETSTFWMWLWLSNLYMLELRSLIVSMCLNMELVYDYVPQMRKYHSWLTLLASFGVFTGTIVFSTTAGMTIVQSILEISEKFTIPFILTLQLIGIVYFYGIFKFQNDIYFMLNIRLSFFWMLCFIANPIIIGGTLIYNFINFIDMKINSLQLAFVSLNVTIFMLFVLKSIIQTVRRKSTLCQPKDNWGPKSSQFKASRTIFHRQDHIRISN